MATAKAERLLNLVIALVNAPRFRTAAWIREKVAGYADAPTEEAFFRTFERDKTELRDLGIPLQTDGNDGYRIPPGEFALPEMSFSPAEFAALGLAGRLWETTALGDAGLGALRKLRDANPARIDEADSQPDPLSRTAVGLLQPRVRTGDPAFEPLFAAVRARRPVIFEYRKTIDDAAEVRSVEPWGLVSFRGRWYLVAWDKDRDARRTFRLSRIVGDVRAVGRAGAVRIPENLDLLGAVAANVDTGPTDRTGTVLVRPGRGAGLRRISTPTLHTPNGSDNPDWDQLEIPVRHLWDTARTIAGSGPDVVVLEPPDLRAAVIRLLAGAARNADQNGTDHRRSDHSGADRADAGQWDAGQSNAGQREGAAR